MSKYALRLDDIISACRNVRHWAGSLKDLEECIDDCRDAVNLWDSITPDTMTDEDFIRSILKEDA